MPSITAIVPSYNHERFVLEAIGSVLRQSVPVDEVIVVDDGSTDGSVRAIRSISDPRVRLIVQPENLGGSETLNAGIRAASSDLVAICNSDDMWEPWKLERQLAVLEESPELAAVFTDVAWINRFGHTAHQHADDPVFRTGNHSRHGWIKLLVETHNRLCHPSVLIRRQAYERTGLYDNRLRQLPDYKMWLSLARFYDWHVMDEKLVRFRLHDNTSAPSPSSSTRDRNEFASIIEDFFAKLDETDFHLAFGTRYAPHDERFNLAMEKFLYLWSVPGEKALIFRSIADRILMELMETEEGLRAWRAYGFSPPQFHILRGLQSPWINLRDATSVSPDEGRVLEVLLEHPIEAGSVSALQHPLPPRVRGRAKITREIRRIGRQAKSLLHII